MNSSVEFGPSEEPRPAQLPRAEYLRDTVADRDFGIVVEPLTTWEMLYNQGALRKALILILLAIAWESYARILGNELVFPTLTITLQALWDGLVGPAFKSTWIPHGEILIKCLNSMQLLLLGYISGIFLAVCLTAIAMSSQIGNDVLETLTSMFNPLPAIAFLPISLIWFGVGDKSIIFVLIHSVLWAFALNTYSGFRSVSDTLRMVGRNCGLSGLGYVVKILIPAAFPAILTGLKISWAFAWRTLIAAELVFGASSGSGGLGWYIYESKTMLDIPNVFAGLLTVILIGLLVDNLIFRKIEKVTVKKWGMQL
jgi:NitT/TauT family transport system permease protein